MRMTIQVMKEGKNQCHVPYSQLFMQGAVVEDIFSMHTS